MSIESYENGLDTRQFAKLALTTPGTVRVRLCKNGDYFGIKPLKLPNGRLLWPANSLERLAAYYKSEAGK